MDPTSPLGIVTSTGAQLAMDAAEDALARRRCLSLLESYDAQSADIPQMRAYARCVELVHGLSDRMPMPLHWVVIAAASGLALGALLAFLRTRTMRGGDPSFAVFVFVMGGTLGGTAALLVAAIIWRIAAA